MKQRKNGQAKKKRRTKNDQGQRIDQQKVIRKKE